MNDRGKWLFLFFYVHVRLLVWETYEQRACRILAERRINGYNFKFTACYPIRRNQSELVYNTCRTTATMTMKTNVRSYLGRQTARSVMNKITTITDRIWLQKLLYKSNIVWTKELVLRDCNMYSYYSMIMLNLRGVCNTHLCQKIQLKLRRKLTCVEMENNFRRYLISILVSEYPINLTHTHLTNIWLCIICHDANCNGL